MNKQEELQFKKQETVQKIKKIGQMVLNASDITPLNLIEIIDELEKLKSDLYTINAELIQAFKE